MLVIQEPAPEVSPSRLVVLGGRGLLRLSDVREEILHFAHTSFERSDAFGVRLCRKAFSALGARYPSGLDGVAIRTRPLSSLSLCHCVLLNIYEPLNPGVIAATCQRAQIHFF
jgi:hypothetical protein